MDEGSWCKKRESGVLMVGLSWGAWAFYDDRAAASVFSWRMLVCLQDFDFRQAVGGEGDGCGGIVALDMVRVAMEEVQLNPCQSQRWDLNQVM